MRSFMVPSVLFLFCCSVHATTAPLAVSKAYPVEVVDANSGLVEVGKVSLELVKPTFRKRVQYACVGVLAFAASLGTSIVTYALSREDSSYVLFLTGGLAATFFGVGMIALDFFSYKKNYLKFDVASEESPVLLDIDSLTWDGEDIDHIISKLLSGEPSSDSNEIKIRVGQDIFLTSIEKLGIEIVYRWTEHPKVMGVYGYVRNPRKGALASDRSEYLKVVFAMGLDALSEPYYAAELVK